MRVCVCVRGGVQSGERADLMYLEGINSSPLPHPPPSDPACLSLDHTYLNVS